MRHRQRLLTIALVAGLLAAALVLLAAGGRGALAQGTIIYVDVDAPGANNGTSWANAYTDLQDALDVAGTGDQIWVAAGTYKPTSGTDRTISFRMKNGVAIYGGFAGTESQLQQRDWVDNLTVLSGDLNGDDGLDFANYSDNAYHVFYHPAELGLEGTAILDGCTISGANANGADLHGFGGGMLNGSASPTLTNVTFTDNRAGSGGGMWNDESSPTLTGCTFAGNSANLGGGMFNDASSPSLTGCAFADNSGSDSGGGMSNYDGSVPTLTGCTFTGNSAEYGGGMLNWSSSPTLTGCTFSGNSAGQFGGGMHNYSSASPTLTNCTFAGNSAVVYGGGMMNIDRSSPVLANCTFAGNSADYGGGMLNYTGTSPALTNCTFWGNAAGTVGGAIANSQASPKLTNCILWGNGPDQMFDGVSTPAVTYCDVEGGYPGDTNIDEDPRFVDPAQGDFHLMPGSPCIDAGNNAAPHLPAFDFEGDERILDGDADEAAIVDMGVDEAFWYSTYVPLVLRNY